jgi:uncharacterized protein YaeQ
VALSSTLYVFDIDLALNDRGVYETLSLRVARHPSESEEYLVTRVLAYCCEYRTGIEFSSGGLSEPDDPAIAVRDLTGRMQTWIDIGTPAADRLHRASKAAARVAVYQHRDAPQWLEGLRAARMHRANALEIYTLDRQLVTALVETLDRRMSLAVSLSDAELMVASGETTLAGALHKRVGLDSA